MTIASFDVGFETKQEVSGILLDNQFVKVVACGRLTRVTIKNQSAKNLAIDLSFPLSATAVVGKYHFRYEWVSESQVKFHFEELQPPRMLAVTFFNPGQDSVWVKVSWQ